MAAAWRIAMVAWLACWLGACSMEFLAERMVSPPNGGHVTATAPAKAANGAPTRPAVSASEVWDATRIDITVGPPEATLATWVMEPKGPIRGTVLVLHGFLGSHHQVENAARGLRDAGYRAVLVDLRGHGKSTGKYITFGVHDARDLAQVTTELQRRGLCGERVGVYGTSYGAASGILFAGADERVAAVVSVACFATLRDEAPHFARRILPVPGDFLSDKDFAAILNAAGRIAQFNPDDASPVTAIARTRAPVLLIHGSADAITPVEASRELHAAAVDHSELDVITGQGHLILSWDPLGELRGRTRGWFDRYLADGAGRQKLATNEHK